MKILLIGYGSIGRRHEEVLFSFSTIKEIHIVTKQTVPNKTTFKNLQEVDNLGQYDYIVIASETYKHFEQLKYLENNVSNKLIFCEKPLFETDKELIILKNIVSVGYVLRFHPLMQKLKHYLKNEKIISSTIVCGQYLPTWRKEIDYKTSYSAIKAQGGGVLLDLSHEIDYAQWLFGDMIDIKSYQLKVSDLEIDSDDLVTLISKTQKGVIVTLSIDYISKITYRKMIIHTIENTYELDFISNLLTQKNRNGLEQKHEAKNLERNTMFEKMHISILSNQHDVCTYEEAKNVMKTISIIQEQNK
ncbi:Gfo/Idh/MocA family oxidoreductase [Sulfurimonas sp.]|uniref:Gfo/Idh/MocA family protein n=1 Tax=Sulfurimonas sp. TaxID=2022749 RepID=UPI00262F7A91|nr:Gfo/Idh/MocA family oxidoreductase [Sulfurimonas sp.]MDD5156444.1 Gfo/Idh/MocA family oxidoreductase [Sulfurimonas sp.]